MTAAAVMSIAKRPSPVGNAQCQTGGWLADEVQQAGQAAGLTHIQSQQVISLFEKSIYLLLVAQVTSLQVISTAFFTVLIQRKGVAKTAFDDRVEMTIGLQVGVHFFQQLLCRRNPTIQAAIEVNKQRTGEQLIQLWVIAEARGVSKNPRQAEGFLGVGGVCDFQTMLQQGRAQARGPGSGQTDDKQFIEWS